MDIVEQAIADLSGGRESEHPLNTPPRLIEILKKLPPHEPILWQFLQMHHICPAEENITKKEWSEFVNDTDEDFADSASELAGKLLDDWREENPPVFAKEE